MKTRIITIIVALLSLTAGHAAEGIQIATTTLKPGETKDITLSLSQNTEKYAGIQFDIKLPEGLSLVTTGSEVYYAFPSNQADDLTCNVTKTAENAYRFMLYSNSLKLFKSGDLLTLRLKAGEGIALKEYTIELNDVRLSDIDGAVTKLGNSTATVKVAALKGDANGDGAVNAADIVEVVNYIMGSPSAIFDNKAADVNGDGVVNAADIVEIVNIIMAAG
jgi:hypothetical protein